jgi:HPt (histidine-containing phosphotransfer) domain-containing protein/CheY-like chemotaxis protein
MDASSAKNAPKGAPAKADNNLAIWLVNDDPAQLMVQKRLLGRVATIQGFLSPIEALAAARMGESSPFLITDFHMPGMDGTELAQVWCELHRDARVLLISASEISRQEQDKVDSLPVSSVMLLTSYRITDLQEQALTWFRQEASPLAETLATRGSSARLDRSVLEKLSRLGGPGFADKTIARFLQNGPEKVRHIETALAEGNHTLMHELSHALKGSCGLVGALSLAAAADKIEDATAEGGNKDNLQAQVREVVAECQATIVELERFLL